MEGDANDASMTNKHDVEAHSSNEAAASKLASGEAFIHLAC